MNFKYLSERKRHQQTFDKDKIFIEKCGKKINIDKMIQEARDGTEIIPTLLKYGTIEKMGMDTGKVYSDMLEIKDLRDIYDAKEKADLLWNQLPVEVRAEFNHNPQDFMKNGENWLKEKLKKETPTQNEKTEQPKTNEGVNNE